MNYIVLNEDSLHNKFTDLSHFKKGVKDIIPLLNILEDLEIVLMKSTEIYSITIYRKDGNDIRFNQLLAEGDDEFLKLKTYLLTILDDPYIADNVTKTYDVVKSNGIEIILGRSSGISYAIEKNYPLLSFSIVPYNSSNSLEYSNGSIQNIFNLETFNEYYLVDHEISIEYITNLFRLNKSSSVNLSLLESKNGFESLNKYDTNIFFKRLLYISKLSMSEIKLDSSLNYKHFNANGLLHQKYKDKNLYKLRINKTYRCIGIEDNEQFFPIKFETDHTLSDKG